MEPDPSPATSDSEHSNETQFTNQDINQILGITKKGKSRPSLYLFSKKIIILVASITTFVYLSFYYFGGI